MTFAADDETVLEKFRGKTFLVSPAYGQNMEQHHHTAVFDIRGPKTLDVHMGYGVTANDWERVLNTAHYSFQFKVTGPIDKKEYQARYGSRRVNWWMIEESEDTWIERITHTYRESRTNWLHGPIQNYKYLGGRMRYSVALPPNYVDGDPYPLVVSVGGSGELGDDGKILVQTDPGCILCKQRKIYEDYPAIHITVQIPYDRDFTEEIIDADGEVVIPDTAGPYHTGWHRYYQGNYYGGVGLMGLIEELPYNITRKYITGFSGGGLFCYEMLRWFPKYWDAVVPIGGWAIGQAYQNVQESPYWDAPYNGGDSLLDRLKKIYTDTPPVIAVSGDRDNMKYGTQAYADHIPNSQLAIVPASHGGSPKVFWNEEANFRWLLRQGFKAMKLTAQDSGYYVVYLDGVKQSQHIAEREAIENVWAFAEQYPDSVISYKHEYEVLLER